MGTVNIVVGLSGVGKSTVLEESRKISSQSYQVINYGDRMLDIAMDKGLVESRDEIKEMSSKEQKEVQMEAAESILEDSKKGNIIVDTHAAIQTPHGYLPGLPKWTIENLEPDHLIILDASAEEIYERSKDDSGRNREHDSIQEVETYRQVAREMTSVGAVMTGAYLKIIKNSDGMIHQASEELVKILE